MSNSIIFRLPLVIRAFGRRSERHADLAKQLPVTAVNINAVNIWLHRLEFRADHVAEFGLFLVQNIKGGDSTSAIISGGIVSTAQAK